MPFVQSIQIIASQGTNTINKTSYVSGVDFPQSAPYVPSSGIASGIAYPLTQSGVVSLAFGNNLPTSGGTQLTVKFYSLSGSVSFSQPANGGAVWWSGNGFSNPLASASGDIIAYSLQIVSGYSTTNCSGFLFNAQAITITP